MFWQRCPFFKSKSITDIPWEGREGGGGVNPIVEWYFFYTVVLILNVCEKQQPVLQVSGRRQRSDCFSFLLFPILLFLSLHPINTSLRAAWWRHRLIWISTRIYISMIVNLNPQLAPSFFISGRCCWYFDQCWVAWFIRKCLGFQTSGTL